MSGRTHIRSTRHKRLSQVEEIQVTIVRPVWSSVSIWRSTLGPTTHKCHLGLCRDIMVPAFDYRLCRLSAGIMRRTQTPVHVDRGTRSRCNRLHVTQRIGLSVIVYRLKPDMRLTRQHEARVTWPRCDTHVQVEPKFELWCVVPGTTSARHCVRNRPRFEHMAVGGSCVSVSTSSELV